MPLNSSFDRQYKEQKKLKHTEYHMWSFQNDRWFVRLGEEGRGLNTYGIRSYSIIVKPCNPWTSHLDLSSISLSEYRDSIHNITCSNDLFWKHQVLKIDCNYYYYDLRYKSKELYILVCIKYICFFSDKWFYSISNHSWSKFWFSSFICIFFPYIFYFTRLGLWLCKDSSFYPKIMYYNSTFNSQVDFNWFEYNCKWSLKRLF